MTPIKTNFVIPTYQPRVCVYTFQNENVYEAVPFVVFIRLCVTENWSQRNASSIHCFHDKLYYCCHSLNTNVHEAHKYVYQTDIYC